MYRASRRDHADISLESLSECASIHRHRVEGMPALAEALCVLRAGGGMPMAVVMVGSDVTVFLYGYAESAYVAVPIPCVPIPWRR